MRGSRWATVALLLLLTSALLPWWVVTNHTGGTSTVVEAKRLWARDEMTRTDVGGAALLLVVAASAVVLVRTAAVSWKNEPASWRRDLGIASGAVLAALVLAWAMPLELGFWGTRRFDLGSTTFAWSSNPGLGWWLALAALACLLLAHRAARTEPGGG